MSNDKIDSMMGALAATRTPRFHQQAIHTFVKEMDGRISHTVTLREAIEAERARQNERIYFEQLSYLRGAPPNLGPKQVAEEAIERENIFRQAAQDVKAEAINQNLLLLLCH